MTSGKDFPAASPGPVAGARRGPKAQRGQVADQILTAARTAFAHHGYAATTVRSIAEVAGVDPASVTYYYSGKAGLLAAAVEPPAGFVEAASGAAAVPLRYRGRALVEALLNQWENPDTAAILRSIVLTAAHEPIAMNRLRTVFAENLLAAVSSNLDDDERALRAGLVASQMIGVAMARYIWQVGALADLPPEDIIRYVAPTIQRYLSARL